MSLLNLFTKNAITKNPTAKQDYIAYSQGAKSEYDSTYNDYVQSVEALDKAVRVIANIASMAKIETFSEMANGKLKPLKIKNVDFTYNTNDQDSEHDLLSILSLKNSLAMMLADLRYMPKRITSLIVLFIAQRVAKKSSISPQTLYTSPLELVLVT
jgi:hypothetical protein